MLGERQRQQTNWDTITLPTSTGKSSPIFFFNIKIKEKPKVGFKCRKKPHPVGVPCFLYANFFACLTLYLAVISSSQVFVLGEAPLASELSASRKISHIREIKQTIRGGERCTDRVGTFTVPSP